MPKKVAAKKIVESESESESEGEYESEEEQEESADEGEFELESDEFEDETEESEDLEEEVKVIPKKPQPKKVVPKKSPPKKVAPKVKKAAPKKASPKKVIRPKKTEDEEEVATVNSKRTFVIIVDKITPKAGSPSISYKDLRRKAKNNDVVLATYGSYKGVKPDQAAKKALSAIVRAAGTDKQCAYVFTIKETTSTRNKNIPNEFSFVGMSRPLPGGPKTIKKKTTEYQVKHETVVRPYNPVVKYNYKEWPTKKRVTKSK